MKVLFVSSGNKGRRVNILADNQARSLRDIGITVDSFYITEKGLFGYLKSIGKINNCLSEKYDIIHAHYGLCGIVGAMAKKNQKLIVSFMGDDLSGSVKAGKYTLFSKIMVYINKFCAAYFYDYVIVKSHKHAKSLCRTTKYAVIPNGVDFKVFYPVDKKNARNILGLDNKKALILFASSKDRQEKNFPLAEQAMKILANQDCELLELKNKTQAELNLLYNSANCLILTSYHEGSPNVIKEAMACNCPIVSTKVGDVEWVMGGIEGCYFSSFEVTEFGEKIKKALDYSSSYARTTGRERILELGIDSETIAEKIINVYTRVLREK